MALALWGVSYLLAARPAHASGVNLSWNDCGTAGLATKTYACNSNTGSPFTLVGSFVPPPGIQALTGFNADLRVISGADTLPDWWRHGSGQCRSTTDLLTNFNFTSGPFTCTDVLGGQGSGGWTYDIGYYGPATARIHLTCSVPGNVGPLDPATEYYAFQVVVTRTHSAGITACAGCSQGAQIEFAQIQLLQPTGSGPSPVLSNPVDRSFVTWQSVPALAPTVSGFSPPAGPAGTLVRVSGSRFLNVSRVRFGVMPATYGVQSDSVLFATAPVGVRSGPIEVTTAQGAASSASSFVAAPRILGIAPGSGAPGQPVWIEGVNFLPADSVRFGSVAASFHVLSDTLIRTWVPTGAVTAAVAVHNAGGTAGTASSFVVLPPDSGSASTGDAELLWNDCSTAGRTLETFACDGNTGAPAQLVVSFVPPPGVGELTGLLGTLRVTTEGELPDWWKHGSDQCRGWSDLAVLFDPSSRNMCAYAWAGDVTGGYEYQVGYGGPNSARLSVSCSLNSGSSHVLDPALQYYAFIVELLRSHTKGAGSCSGCSQPAALTLDSLQLLQPAGVGFNPVIVPRTLNSRVYWQRVTAPAPVIRSFTPAGGPSGSVVRVHGSGFDGASVVTLGDLPAIFDVVADSILDATVPANARSAPIRVTNAYATGSSDSEFVLPPSLRSFVPSQAQARHMVYLTGGELRHVRTVTFAGIPASFTIRSDSVVAAPVPDSASSGPIEVTSPGGTASVDGFVVGPVTGVDPSPAAGFSLGRTSPNPLATRTSWTLNLPVRSTLTGYVLDARGARVTTLVEGEWAAGSHLLTWDGRDARGGRVRPGIYFVRITAGDTSWRRTVVVLR